MPQFSKQEAEKQIAVLAMSDANLRLARYWLSLWPGDALPRRAALNPAKLKHHLPNLLLFDVVPDTSVTIRLAGTQIVRSIRMELTGRDWVELAPPDYRAERLRVFSSLARGAIGFGHRRIPLTHGEHYISEEILLPFAPEADGMSPVMCHMDGNAQPHVEISPVREAFGSPVDFSVYPLPVLTLAA